MHAQRDVSEEHYSASEAMERLRVSRGSFYSLVNAGVITKLTPPGRKNGVYSRREIDALAEAGPLRRPPRIAPLLAASAEGERRGTMTIGPAPEQLATMEEVYWQSLYSTLLEFTGQTYVAPLPAPRATLDIGCRSGRWASEAAQAGRERLVVGVETVPPQSSRMIQLSASRADRLLFGHATPSGAALVDVDDADEAHDMRTPRAERLWRFVLVSSLMRLPFADGRFDLVRIAFQKNRVDAADWPALLREARRVTAPGGWIECLEFGVLTGGGPALTLMNKWEWELLIRQGCDPDIAPRLPDALIGTGLDTVHAEVTPLPLYARGETASLFFQMSYFVRLSVLQDAVVAAEITSRAEYNKKVWAAYVETAVPNTVTWPLHVAIGQRPEVGEDDGAEPPADL
jgi:SAM-dependent methyltransferase